MSGEVLSPDAYSNEEHRKRSHSHDSGRGLLQHNQQSEAIEARLLCSSETLEGRQVHCCRISVTNTASSEVGVEWLLLLKRIHS